jgi:DNA adenine methylase
MGQLVQPLKWHGGKHYLAGKIIEKMPPRCKNPNAPGADDPGWLHYCEPCFGGGAVLLANDPTGISEVVNDLDGRLTNFWRVLQGIETFQRFKRILEVTPFSEPEFVWAEHEHESDAVQDAVNFFIRCRQSLAGRMSCFSPISRNRTRRAMNEQASSWLGAVEGLAAVHERLKGVVILSREAVEVIRQQDGPRTLFYIDPPYLHETRASKDVYRFEMEVEKHQEILGAIRECVGKVMISGYRSRLYEEVLGNWSTHEFNVPNQAAGGSEKRRMTEVLWCNF